MAAFKYEDLLTEYDYLDKPLIDIEVGGRTLLNNKDKVAITNIIVDLTCGFEASQASFDLVNIFDKGTSQFNNDAIKKFILIGSSVKISAGYNMRVREVFRGVICRVNYSVERDTFSRVTVICMDLKCIMMANHYHKQMTALCYSEAVKEIFDQSVYDGLKGSDGVFEEVKITDTPDKQEGEGGGGSSQDTDVSIEMVGESDYEFVVRAAKKFNYEFFFIGGQLLFRKAKSDTTLLIEFGAETRMTHMEVGYDITGIVEKVTVRGLNVGQAKVITAEETNGNKLSQGSKAKQVIKGSQYVYVDPTISSTADAQSRAKSLIEDISYRFGSLDMELYGLPELIPGRFIMIKDFGVGVENKFYVTSVQHRLGEDGFFYSRVRGKSAGMLNS